jgi:hypothetical protein
LPKGGDDIAPGEVLPPDDYRQARDFLDRLAEEAEGKLRAMK